MAPRGRDRVRTGRSRRWLPVWLLLAGAIVAVVVATLVRAIPPTSSDSRVVQPGTTTATSGGYPDVTVGLPSSATADSTAGATSFVYYWFDALNHAVQTGDETPLRAASSRGCQPCTTTSVAIDAGYQNGRSLQGGTYTVRSVQVDSFFDLSRPRLRVVYDRSTRSTTDVDNQVIATLPGTTFASCQIILERSEAQWRVVDIQAGAPVA